MSPGKVNFFERLERELCDAGQGPVSAKVYLM